MTEGSDYLFNHFLNPSRSVISKAIGIILWFIPHNSEHWPKNTPGLKLKNSKEFKRPGLASVFKPKEGTAQECNTPSEETKNFTKEKKGKATRLVVSKKRLISFVSNKNLSKLSFPKSEYS